MNMFILYLKNRSVSIYLKMLSKYPKVFQHLLSAMYPKAFYSINTLRAFYPQINIDGGNTNLFVTEDVLVAATVGGIMKTNPLFKDGVLTILACNYDELKKKKETANIIAMTQTKQQHPDYYYIYKSIDKNTGIWQRFYDLKTGQFSINTGHLVCFSNLQEYEKQVQHLLKAQYHFYTDRAIKDKYKIILEDKSLNWSSRNLKIQEFFRDNLHKFPNINPSFLLYNPRLYELDKSDIPKKFTGFINSESLANMENTHIMIAKAISLGGKKCCENYQKHPDNNPFIVKLLQKYITNQTA